MQRQIAPNSHKRYDYHITMPENIPPTPEETKTITGAEAVAATPEAAPKASPDGSRLTADPLSDGTVPTVLVTGDGISGTIKPLIDPSKRRITSIYRRADIVTSFITMIATLAIIGIIFGGYLYLNKKKIVPAPKITTLDQTEVTKLGGFLGNNIGNSSNQILTVSSSSLFKGRLAVDNDLKVTGNTEISGSLSTSDLTVTKTSNLSGANIKGALIVTGPTTLQGPAVLAGGATVGSNLAVSGNATFGGAVSAGSFNAKSITVSGDLNLSGHIVISGAQPKVFAEIGAGPTGHASVEGNDSGGTISVSTGTTPIFTNGQSMLVSLKFNNAFVKTPHVLLTAVGLETGKLQYYVTQTPSGFLIGLTSTAASTANYAFNYWVIQ